MLNAENTPPESPPGFLHKNKESFENMNSMLVNKDYDQMLMPEEMIGTKEVLIVETLVVNEFFL